MNDVELYNELLSELPKSNQATRIELAQIIVNEQHDILYLSNILFEDSKVALRFLWLLSDIAEYDATFLFPSLSSLFALRHQNPSVDISEAFPKYWNLCGFPKKDKGVALDLILKLIDSNKINATIKSRSLDALTKLYQEYPEVKNEVISILENQRGKNLPSFEKKIDRVLDILT